MTFDDYQDFTDQTAIYPDAGKGNIVYPALGLCGETGEVAEHIKKVMRGDSTLTPERKEKMLYELGDVLWYVARLATELGYTLNSVAEGNIHKLKIRQAAGKLQGEGSSR